MSRKPWTPERKAAQAQRMRARWRDQSFRSAQTKRLRELNSRPDVRAKASGRMKRLNARMRDDEALKRKCVRGQKRFRRSPIARALRAAEMKELMMRPELRRAARFHCKKINRNPRVRRRQWASRRRNKQRLANG